VVDKSLIHWKLVIVIELGIEGATDWAWKRAWKRIFKASGAA